MRREIIAAILEQVEPHIIEAAPITAAKIQSTIHRAFDKSGLTVGSRKNIAVVEKENGTYSVKIDSDHSQLLISKFMAASARISNAFQLRGQVKVSSYTEEGKTYMRYQFTIKEVKKAA